MGYIQFLPTSLGGEVVINGSPPSAPSWNLGSGWSDVGDGILHTPGATGVLSQTLPLVALQQYYFIITATGITAGSCSLSMGASSFFPIDRNITADGESFFFAQQNDSNVFQIVPSIDFDGKITFVSAKPTSRLMGRILQNIGNLNSGPYRVSFDLKATRGKLWIGSSD